MFQNISINIASFPGEAIVNSLGQGRRVTVPGQIFGSIIEASGQRNAIYKDAEEKWSQYPFGEVFITDSYGLPCQKIIHVITPFKYMDPKNTMIAEIYEKVLKTALDNGITSISVPIIGTGANGYSADTVASIARRICFRFAQEHPEIDVFLNIYTVEVGYEEEREARRQYLRELRGYSAPRISLPSRPSGPTEEEEEYERELGLRFATRREPMGPAPKEKKKETAFPFLKSFGVEFDDSFATLLRKWAYSKAKTKKAQEERLKETWDDIDALLNGFKAGEKMLFYNLKHIHEEKEDQYYKLYKKSVSGKPHSVKYDWRKQKNRDKKGGFHWECPNKVEILMTCIALHLNPEQSFELYAFCGYSLSEFERYDSAFRDCVHELAHRGAWERIMNHTYQFATSEKLTDFRENRRKVPADGPEDW